MNKIEIKRFLEANATISMINIKVEDESLFSCYGLEPLKEGRERNKRLRIPDYHRLFQNIIVCSLNSPNFLK